MKRSHERHALILSMVEAQDYVTIEAMAAACETSSQTIRRDLTFLSDANKILRYHGGARRIGGERAPSYEARSSTHVAEKTAAAALITDLIPDDASIFLAGGSTLEYVARALLKRNRLTVVTNNLQAAMVFNEREDFRVHLVGGWMRATSGSLIGTSTSEAISGFSLNYAIVSARGITTDGWLLEYDQDLVGPVAAMLSNAKTSILVADSSKFGSAGIVRTAHLKQIDHFLTERPLKGELADLLRENQVVMHAPKVR